MALEWELRPALPPGCTMNHSRVGRPGGELLTEESLIAMAEQVDRAAADLKRTNPEVVLYGCTSGSFVGTAESEIAITSRISAQTGCPAVTTSASVLEAIAHLGAATVFLVTPYPEALNQIEIAFLKRAGLGLTGYDSFRCDATRTIASVASEEVTEMVMRHRKAAQAADVVFLSCTNLLTFDQIPLIEKAIGRPVISSNSASLWAVLSRMGLKGGGVGRLFTQE